MSVQKARLERAIEQLQGTVPDGLWDRYSGQEHATVGQERHKLKLLFQDAGNNIFDAVIVDDPSRWSRDNRKSKEGLEILRQHEIKFFTGVTERDLNLPQDRMILGFFTEINEFFGAEQARKSLDSRIARAKQDIPVSGKLPFGRTYDKTHGWGLDAEKVKQIKWAANEYLNGQKMSKLANDLGVNQANLWKILCHRCGDRWEQSFKSKRLGTNEVIPCKIPRILSDDIIAAIRARGSHNRTFCRGKKVTKYLLSGFIYCASCGYILQGQRNHNDIKYYRHPAAGSRKEACSVTKWIRADEIGNAVLAHLYALNGNPAGMERAIKNMTPRLEEFEMMRRMIDEKKIELARAQKAMDRLVKGFSEELIGKDELKRSLDPLREKEASLVETIDGLAKKVASQPTMRGIKRHSLLAQRVLAQTFNSLSGLNKMKGDDARKLVQGLFTGKDEEGKPLGVWMSWDAEKEVWKYEIRAAVGPLCAGALPMSIRDRQELLGIDDEFYPEDYDPIASIVDLSSS